MAEYIEREAVIQEIRAYRGFFQDNPSSDHMILKMEAENIVKDQEAADVALVRHGKWDDIPNRYMSVASKNGSYSGNVTSCSICHEINPNAYRTNYCPNCGAKMDLEESR